MTAETLTTRLKTLKLFGMAQSIEELATQNSPAYQQAVPILDILLKAEVADREVRSVQYQMKVAKFPAFRDLTGFDFAQSDTDETQLRALHRCEFLEEAQNIVLIGGPGTGKTHLATAIGIEAIQQHHKRVRFLSTIELVNQLEQEKLLGKQGRLANRLSHTDLAVFVNIVVQLFMLPNALIASHRRILVHDPDSTRLR